MTVLPTVRAELLGHFELNPLHRGGDAVRVENLSAQSDYQRKKVAHNQHRREQLERERAERRFISKAETHLRVVPIAGDGRCLFRALVSAPRPGLFSCLILLLQSLMDSSHIRRQRGWHTQMGSLWGEGQKSRMQTSSEWLSQTPCAEGLSGSRHSRKYCLALRPLRAGCGGALSCRFPHAIRSWCIKLPCSPVLASHTKSLQLFLMEAGRPAYKQHPCQRNLKAWNVQVLHSARVPFLLGR